MKTGTKYLSEFNKEIEMMFLFWKRNNLDMVNSIIEDIENEFDSIFLHSFYLSSFNLNVTNIPDLTYPTFI